MCKELVHRQRIDNALADFWAAMQNLDLDVAEIRLCYLKRLIDQDVTEANVAAYEIAEASFIMVRDCS